VRPGGFDRGVASPSHGRMIARHPFLRMSQAFPDVSGIGNLVSVRCRPGHSSGLNIPLFRRQDWKGKGQDMASSARILVVDDDRDILELLSKYLSVQGFAVREAASVREMQEATRREAFDLVVLDIMLPDGSGLEACMQMRREGMNTPVILLTAMEEEVDRIIGLEMGADDYMGKPFSPRELVARIKAVLRRSADAGQKADEPSAFEFDGFRVDLASRSVVCPGGPVVQITAAEVDVLTIFLARPHRVVSRGQVLELAH